MPVEDPTTIDAVGVDKASGEVVLTVADALDWDDCRSHLLILQEKINRYMGFIESELAAAYPKAEGRSVRIDVVLRYDPPQEAAKFLAKAADIINENGWSLSWRVHAA